MLTSVIEERFERERAEKEQKRKEREEQHLYLTVRVITNENFKAHEGFDLAPWDEKEGESAASPRSYKMRKLDAFRSLLGAVAQDLDVDSSRIRMWSMVNRQNKTVRPDQPIMDLDISEF